MFSWLANNPMSVKTQQDIEIRVGLEVINLLYKLLCQYMQTNIIVQRLHSDKYKAPTLLQLSKLSHYDASALNSHLSYLLQGSCPALVTKVLYNGKDVEQKDILPTISKLLMFDNVLKINFV